MTYVRTPPYLYEHQDDAVLSQANPVSTTLYTVLNTTKNVRIISMTASVTWTDQPTPLEIIVTIDGNSLIFLVASPASGASYIAFTFPAYAATVQALMLDSAAVSELGGRAFLLEGRSVLIQARTTGGTVSNLTCRVKYAKIP